MPVKSPLPSAFQVESSRYSIDGSGDGTFPFSCDKASVNHFVHGVPLNMAENTFPSCFYHLCEPDCTCQWLCSLKSHELRARPLTNYYAPVSPHSLREQSALLPWRERALSAPPFRLNFMVCNPRSHFFPMTSHFLTSPLSRQRRESSGSLFNFH